MKTKKDLADLTPKEFDELILAEAKRQETRGNRHQRKAAKQLRKLLEKAAGEPPPI